MRVTIRYSNEDLADVAVILDGVTEIRKEGDMMVAVHKSGAKLVTNGIMEISLED